MNQKDLKFPKIKSINLFITLLLISLTISQKLVFENDSLCEQFGSSLIYHIFHNETENKDLSLKNNLYDKFGNITISDIIRNSGSGLNDLGDYLGCKRNKLADYYLMSLGSPLNPLMQTTLGFCYYKECKNKYFQNFTNKLKNQIQENFHINTSYISINFISPNEELEKNNKENNKGMRITIIVIISVLFFELIISLINPKNKFLKAFNLISNSKSLLTVKNQNELFEHLRVFDGIRFFSALYVVFGHVCFYPLILGAKNVIEIIYASKKWYFAIVMSAYYAVDVFFYMSGFFFVFSIQKYLNRKINKFKIVFIGIMLRIFRLLPFMLIAVFGFTYLLPFFSNGPKYSGVIFATKGCLKNYWDTLLFINNLIDYPLTIEDASCFNHGWYLACDMQFFIYSMLIMIIFNNKPNIRKYLFILTFIICSAVQIYIVYKRKFPYNDMVHTGNFNSDDQFQLYYIRPYVRITPYLIGVLFGELFLETRLYKKYNKKVKQEKKSDIEKDIIDINKINDNNSKSKEFEFPLLSSSSQIMQNSFLPTEIQNKENMNNSFQNISNNINKEEEIDDEELEGTDNIYYKINKCLEKNDCISYLTAILAIILFNLVFWNSSISNKLDKGLTLFWSAMFQTFGKVIYIFCLGVLIHLTFLGKLNSFRKILSLKIETQIARGSFGIYVVHIYLIALFFFAYNNNFYIRFRDIALVSVGFFLVSWIITFIVGIIFESPIVVLSKGPAKN